MESSSFRDCQVGKKTKKTTTSTTPQHIYLQRRIATGVAFSQLCPLAKLAKLISTFDAPHSLTGSGSSKGRTFIRVVFCVCAGTDYIDTLFRKGRKKKHQQLLFSRCYSSKPDCLAGVEGRGSAADHHQQRGLQAVRRHRHAGGGRVARAAAAAQRPVRKKHKCLSCTALHVCACVSSNCSM